jgi:predicted TIM-barrel fold metal-dependent hydrolase
MVIDCHTHVCASVPSHGQTSDQLLRTLPFRFMRWKLGIEGNDAHSEQQVVTTLANALDQTPELDAAVVLAFDGVYDDDGTLNLAKGHLYVTNDFVIELCRRYPKMRFGASVHPFRKDAVAEIERCVAAGAVLLKWLPIVQGFSPADERCFPIYEALAHLKLPLLSHTGGERSLIRINDAWADPWLLEPALKRGVTVIAAHCGTRSVFTERDWVDDFVDMLREHEHLYGDTAALCLPPRSHALRRILDDPLLRERVIHGSDWPIPPIPPLALGVRRAVGLLREHNWLRRDVLAKQAMGFDPDYWHRAAKVLRIPTPPAA